VRKAAGLRRHRSQRRQRQRDGGKARRRRQRAHCAATPPCTLARYRAASSARHAVDPPAHTRKQLRSRRAEERG
jgi:hypothetical protein